jgi:hypothetical protein
MWSENDTSDSEAQREERAMRLTINGQEATVSTAADPRLYRQAVRGREVSEVWLADDGAGSAMAMLVNGERAWLIYFRDRDEDPGLSSRNPDYAGPPYARMAFVLDNGQRDEYPIA